MKKNKEFTPRLITTITKKEISEFLTMDVGEHKIKKIEICSNHVVVWVAIKSMFSEQKFYFYQDSYTSEFYGIGEEKRKLYMEFLVEKRFIKTE